MTRARLRRRVLLGVILLVVLAVLGTTAFGIGLVRQAWPQVAGEITLEGLSGPVSVVRDARGVPHVYADSPVDLFRAQGYVTAQDRFFEMDMRRHVTAGRLAELVGGSALPSDKMIRTMGWRRVAEEELPKLAPTTRQYLQAYADGVNDYLARQGETSNLALEYLLLDRQLPDYRVEKWSPVDSLAWLKAMAWDLRGNYSDELARARLQAVLDPALVAALYPPYPTSQHPPILSPQQWSPGKVYAASPVPTALTVDADPGAQAAVTAAYQAIAGMSDLVGRGDGIGSNSWVVGPKRSATGKPLLANDPHLAPGIPGIWYQTGLHCRTVSAGCPFDVSGFTFAGLPGVVIGHNDAIAWGFTNLGPDVTDFYLEKVTDAAYVKDGKQVPLVTRTETLKVRGGEDVTLSVRATAHGPILSDVAASAGEVGRRAVLGGQVQQESYAVSMAWTGLQPGSTADAIFALNVARDFTQFRAAAKQFAVPAQNLVYADTAGNIGYQAPGMIPVRRASTPGVPAGYLPAPGWDSQWDWQGWVAFEDLPWTYNPPEGLIVAANQQVTASSTPYLTSDWDAGWRSARIGERLAALGAVSPADMSAIQLDTKSGFAAQLVPALLAVDLSADPYTREAQDLLRTWDFSHPADASRTSAAAAYFSVVWSKLLQLTFDDQLPTDLRADGGGRWQRAVVGLLGNPTSPWWDDKRTASIVESRDEILTQALVKARLDLTRAINSDVSTWSWGTLHTLTVQHKVIGGDTVPGPVRSLVNRGPIPLAGGSSIVNANAWDASKGYAVTWGPSMRMVVDLSNLDASQWINQTGVSGHPGHPHYSDQLSDWAEGRLVAWPSSAAAVQAAKVDELVFVPKT